MTSTERTDPSGELSPFDVAPLTDKDRAYVASLLAAFNNAVGRQVTAGELLDAYRALQRAMGDGPTTDPARLDFVLDYLRAGGH